MKLLVVEDEPKVREVLAGFTLLKVAERKLDVILFQAGDLRAAQQLVSAADVILCDGHFPTAGTMTLFDQRPWLAVFALARRDIELGRRRFALMSGGLERLEQARRRYGLQTFNKPLGMPRVIEWVFDGSRQLTAGGCMTAGEDRTRPPRLRPHYRAATYSEVAERLGITAYAIQVAEGHAVRKLRSSRYRGRMRKLMELAAELDSLRGRRTGDQPQSDIDTEDEEKADDR